MTICEVVREAKPVVSLKINTNGVYNTNSGEIGSALSQYIGAKDVKYIALDCSMVTTMDSAGLGELAKAHISATRTKTHIAFVAPSKNVMRELQRTHLSSVLNIYDSFPELAGMNANYFPLVDLAVAKARK